MANEINTLENICRGKTVALVGPSGHLAAQSLGETIDSFDVVIRFNGLPTPEVWSDYGSRTDVLFLNMGTIFLPLFREEIRKSGLSPKQISLVYCPKDEFDTRSRDYAQPPESVFDNYEKLGWTIPFQKMQDDEVSILSKTLGGYPTLGAIGILKIASLECKQIFICGFSFYEGFNTYAPNVIKPNKTRVRAVAGHPLRQEVRALQKELVVHKDRIISDKVFERIIFEGKYRGPNLLIQFSQFVRGALLGATRKIIGILNRLNRYSDSGR